MIRIETMSIISSFIINYYLRIVKQWIYCLTCLIHQIFTEYNMYISIDLSSWDSTVRKRDKSHCLFFFETYNLGEEDR